MTEIIESRTLHDAHGWRITAQLRTDFAPAPDGDYYSPADVALFGAPDGWDYVGITVQVCLHGRQIADACLWGVEHGHLSDADADAWLVVAPHVECIDGAEVCFCGSPLADTVIAALADAADWFDEVGITPDAGFTAALEAFAPEPDETRRTEIAEITEALSGSRVSA